MYKYETHLHTLPVSRCARVGIAENLEFYKRMGYDGVFITNHFIDGNIDIDRDLPYEERIRFYFNDYEQALEIGKAMELKVFCGVELSYDGTDFLIYGLDKEWYLAHPEIEGMKKSGELTLMMNCGALIIQAHPFREAAYIDHIQLFPRYVHGVEIFNANRTEFENQLAAIYAAQYGLLTFAGTDNHLGAGQKVLSGVCCREPIADVQDFIQKVKSGQTEIFTLANE